MTEPNEQYVADLPAQRDARAGLLERMPYLCAGIILATILAKIYQRDWASAVALLAPLGLMIVYRAAENNAFTAGWNASAFRGSALLEEHAVSTAARTEILAHLATPPTLLSHRRHMRMMFTELSQLDEPTPEAIHRVMRKYR